MVEMNISKQYCKCGNCGGDAAVDTSAVLTTYPAQYHYQCPNCGHTGTAFCDDIFCKINTSTQTDNGKTVIRNLPEIKKIIVTEGFYYPSIGDVIGKINEIIDAINEMGKI